MPKWFRDIAKFYLFIIAACTRRCPGQNILYVMKNVCIHLQEKYLHSKFGATAKILSWQIWRDGQDSFITKLARRSRLFSPQIWHDGQDSFTTKLTRRARFFSDKFGTTGIHFSGSLGAKNVEFDVIFHSKREVWHLFSLLSTSPERFFYDKFGTTGNILLR